MSSGLSKYREEQDYHYSIGNISRVSELKPGDRVLINTDKNEVGVYKTVECHSCKHESKNWIRIKNQSIGTFLKGERMNNYYSDAVIKMDGLGDIVLIDPMYLKKI